MLSKPDKDAGIVVMKRNVYLLKMENLLNDRKTVSDEGKTIAIGKRLIKYLCELKQQAVIDEHMFEKVKPTGSKSYLTLWANHPGSPLFNFAQKERTLSPVFGSRRPSW